MLGRRTGAVVASIVLAAGIAACGGDDSSSSEDDASAAAVEILSSQDPATCQRLSDTFIETQYGASGEEGIAACEEGIVAGEVPDNISVTDITVDGDSATGSITSDQATADFGLVSTDGEWQLDTLTNIAPVDTGTDTTGGDTTDTTG